MIEIVQKINFEANIKLGFLSTIEFYNLQPTGLKGAGYPLMA